jgi:hypothetical protein
MGLSELPPLADVPAAAADAAATAAAVAAAAATPVLVLSEIPGLLDALRQAVPSHTAEFQQFALEDVGPAMTRRPDSLHQCIGASIRTRRILLPSLVTRPLTVAPAHTRRILLKHASVELE